MWIGNVQKFAEKYELRAQRALLFRATAEHLIARSEEGTDSLENVVAACWYCNSRRHRAHSPLSPDKYAKKVRARLAMGRWHQFAIPPHFQ